jgi:hypothetical protein
MLWKLFQSKWTAVGWTIIIFILMILPPGSLPNRGIFGVPNLDKLVHMVMFGGFVWFWYYSRNTESKTKSLLFRLVLLSAVYGISMEFVQENFTERNFDIWDIVADISGATLVWIWINKWGKK